MSTHAKNAVESRVPKQAPGEMAKKHLWLNGERGNSAWFHSPNQANKRPEHITQQPGSTGCTFHTGFPIQRLLQAPGSGPSTDMRTEIMQQLNHSPTI